MVRGTIISWICCVVYVYALVTKMTKPLVQIKFNKRKSHIAIIAQSFLDLLVHLFHFQNHYTSDLLDPCPLTIFLLLSPFFQYPRNLLEQHPCSHKHPSSSCCCCQLATSSELVNMAQEGWVRRGRGEETRDRTGQEERDDI